MQYWRMHGRGNARGCGVAQHDADDARGCTVEGTDSVPIAELSQELSKDLRGVYRSNLYWNTWCLGTRNTVKLFRVLSVLHIHNKVMHIMISTKQLMHMMLMTHLHVCHICVTKVTCGVTGGHAISRRVERFGRSIVAESRPKKGRSPLFRFPCQNLSKSSYSEK